MNQTEEMVALKKVYADMILNTTKESAVRVMAAESKAHKCEKELASTKEEAVRLLLRLKHMIDTQKKEAEAKSLNDQKRIEELEAQLDEAEGMIIDLRAKLNSAEDQIESLKDKYKRLSSRKEIIYLPNHSKPSMYTQTHPVFPYSKSVSEPAPVISETPVSFSNHSKASMHTQTYLAFPYSKSVSEPALVTSEMPVSLPMPSMYTQTYPAFPYSKSVSEPAPVVSEIPVSLPMPSNHSKASMCTQTYPVFPYSKSVSDPAPVISEIPVSLPITSNHSKASVYTQTYPAFTYSKSVSEPAPVVSEIPVSLPMPSNQIKASVYLKNVSEPAPVISEIPVSLPMPGILVHEGITSHKDIPVTLENKEPEVYDDEGCERVQESETISLPKPSTCDHDCVTSSKEITKSSSGCHSGSVNSSVPASAPIESNELYEEEPIQESETSLPDEKMQTEDESELEPIEESVAIETSLPDEKMQTEDESELEPKRKRRNAKTKSLSCLRTEKWGIKDGLRNDIAARDQHGKFHRLPRRTVRYGRVKAASSKRRSGIITMPAFTRCKRSVSGNSSKTDDTPKREPRLIEKLQDLQPKKFEAVSVVRRSIRKRKAKDWNTLDKAYCLSGKNVGRQVTGSRDVLKVEDPSMTHEVISGKDATFNADTLEQPAKKTFANAGTLVDHEENSARGETLYEDANLIDIVITEAPIGFASHMNLVKTPTIGSRAKEEIYGNPLEDDVNLIDVVILQQEPDGLDSSMKSDNTTTAPVDCKVSEVNSSRTIIHTFSRKRKARSSVVPLEVNPAEESSLKKQRGGSGDECKNLADESSSDSRISSMQVAAP